MFLTKTIIPSVVFPAIAPAQTAVALAIQFQLQQSEWWSEAELREIQRLQLEKLIDHAARTVPHYQKALRRVGFEPGKALSWEMFRDLPLLDRVTVQKRTELMRSPSPPKEHGRVGIATTSGSTGMPVAVARTELCNLMWRAITLREHFWHRRRLEGKLVAIRYAGKPEDAAPPHGKRRDGWGMATDDVVQTGPSVLLNVFSDVGAQWDFVVRENPEYLLTYPTNLRALLDAAEASGKRATNLREVRTVSEMIPQGLRERTREVLGVRLVDMYSTKEIGYLALQHPDNDSYLVQSETCVLEVLRDDNSPCGPGEVGRIVVTDLHNFAQPMIRYDLGDFAEVGEPSPCGRGLPVLRKILGRTRNLLCYPDGKRAWPFFPDKLFRGIAPINQFQVIQRAIDKLELKLVSERPLSDGEVGEVKALMINRLGSAFDFEVTQHSKIPRSASGKYEDFRSEILR